MGRIKTLVAILTLTLGWTVLVQAEPLKPEHVAADAKWLAHLDADAARSSPVVQEFCEECLKDWPGSHEWTELREKWDVDFAKDLHGVTLYGAKIARHHNVAIIHANLNKEAMLKKLEKMCVETAKHGAHTIYMWTKHKETKHEYPVAVALFKPDTLVVSSDVDVVKSALDVLDGKSPSLAGKESPLTTNIPSGTIFLARATGLKDAEAADKFPVFKLLEQFSYAKGQRDDKWFGQFQVVADSPQVAEKIKEVYKGHLAGLWLHFHGHPGVLKLLDTIQLKVDGSTLQGSFEAPVGQVVEQVPTICKAFKEHWKHHLKMCHKMLSKYKMYEKKMHERPEKKEHDHSPESRKEM